MRWLSLKSLLAIVFISVTWVNLNHERWKNKDVIQHDIINYYSYLPALFYENDLSLSFLNDSINVIEEGAHYWPHKLANGNRLIKMSMGMAVGYFPFFCMAHVCAKIFNYPVNGFSEPYHFAVLFSSLFYFLIGLVFLWRVLKLHFTERVAFFTLICICFGTNVFYYLTIGGGLTHPMDFTFFAAFTYYSIVWHQKPNYKTALIIGFILGFMVLVRPINVLAFLIFVLYKVDSFDGFGVKLKFLLSQGTHLFLILVVAFFVFLPQMLYWKSVTDNFLFNSYVGERFYFNNPHVLYGLFSFRKGWLVYTPILIFSIIGIIFLRGELKKYFFPTIIFFCVYIYVTFSWWCWWYGGSFGQRVLIDIYPLLSIPFAAFLIRAWSLSLIWKRACATILCMLIVLNLFQTMQAKYNIIHYDSMTKENYFKIFFSTSKSEERERYLKHPDYKKALRGKEEY